MKSWRGWMMCLLCLLCLSRSWCALHSGRIWRAPHTGVPEIVARQTQPLRDLQLAKRVNGIHVGMKPGV